MEINFRLSSFASKQLTTNNPNIADLSDRNRPTKLGEKFEQLYDNEWSEAFEYLKGIPMDEDQILKTLVDISQVRCFKTAIGSCICPYYKCWNRVSFIKFVVQGTIGHHQTMSCLMKYQTHKHIIFLKISLELK